MFDRSRLNRLAALCVPAVLAGLAAAGCEDDVPTDPAVEARPGEMPPASAGDGPDDLDHVQRAQLAELRRATARYHDVEKAMADGWEVRFPEPCLTHSELGGMGFHLLNPDLLDGAVAVTEPEFLVYEPGPDGALRLVAVEYVVPFSIRPSDASPPELFGHDLHANETFGVWALHAWVWRHNPSGVFADWNPLVSCEHADGARVF